MFGIEKDYQKLLEQAYGFLGEKSQMTEQKLEDKLLPEYDMSFEMEDE